MASSVTHKEKDGGSSSVLKENLGPRVTCPKRTSNMWNMNIHCYFITGKAKHRKKVGLDVTTMYGQVLLKKTL